MYVDSDSMKAFEREFARERLAEEARDVDRCRDSDLVDGHFRSADRAWTVIVVVVAACVFATLAAFRL
jgi:hypothetical protein